MDTMHPWALWRLLLIALIALPFVIAVVIAGFRQRRTDATNATSGPGAWRVESDGSFEIRPIDDVAVVKKCAA
jgi:hypothetical protein